MKASKSTLLWVKSGKVHCNENMQAVYRPTMPWVAQRKETPKCKRSLYKNATVALPELRKCWWQRNQEGGQAQVSTVSTRWHGRVDRCKCPTAQGETGVQEYRDLSGCPGEMPGYLFSLKDSCLLLQALSSILSTIKEVEFPECPLDLWANKDSEDKTRLQGRWPLPQSWVTKYITMRPKGLQVHTDHASAT